MRALIITCAALALTACGDVEARRDFRDSDIVRQCWNGAMVVRNPDNGRLLGMNAAGTAFGHLAPGVTPKQFCEAQ